MRLLSLLALFSALSLAKEPDAIKLLKKSAEDHPITSSFNVEKLYTQEGVVEISGAVSVPLIGIDSMDPLPYVQVTTEDGKTQLFAVDLFSAGVWVTEEYAEKAGAKLKDVHSAGAKHEAYKIAKIPGFSIGEAKFGEMVAWATYSPESSNLPVSGLIGLQTFPELAAAVIASAGELRLAPASDAASLQSAVQGGTKLSYSELAPELIKDGKDMKWVNGRRPVTLQGKLGDREVLVTLSASGHDYASPTGDSVATRDSLAGLKPGRRFGVQGHHYGSLALGELQPFTVDLVEGPSLALTKWHWNVMLTAEVTSRWDAAIDPVNHTLVVAEAAAVKRSSGFDAVIAETQKGLEPNPETGEPPKPVAQAGVYSKLATYISYSGNPEAALSSAMKALENDPESCATHAKVGEVLLYDMGRYGEAAAHLTEAAQRYDTWMELPLNERDQINEDKAKVEKDDGVWDGPMPQSHSCASAWGRAAHAELAQGHVEKVLEIYKEHTDLDWRLPLVAGNALASQGRVKEAEAAYRQALRLGGAASAAPSLALALLQAETGRLDDAIPNFMDAMFSSATGLQAARAYGAAVSAVRGPVAGEAALKNLAEANPNQPHLALAYAEALVAGGKDASGPIATAVAAYEAELRLYDRASHLLAGYGAALRLAGRGADAEKAATRALKINPTQGLAMLVLADLAADAGDAAKAAEWRAKAAQSDADIPTMAPLLAQR